MPYIDRLKATCNKLGCGFKYDEPLKNHTTFKIGGKCKCLIDINSAEALKEILCILKQEDVSYFVIGRGSNILVSDEGYDGVILHIGKLFAKIEKINDTDIRCTSGVSLKDICLYAMENALTGLEFAYGIPGTCGGALFMNAGAYGGEIKDVIVAAKMIDRTGKIHLFSAEELHLSYRHSIVQEQGLIVVSALFAFEQGDRAQIKAQMQELNAKRREKQPLEYGSAGSTFKRPEGYFAGKLIEDAGLKGYRVGDIMVSEKHCGFVVNVGQGTCAQADAVIRHVQQTVKEQFGVTLETEVKRLPEQ